jgi:tetratricopeptide (TPR) repeat protein
MMHALLWVALLLQTQATAPAIPPEAVSLLQSGIQAENSNDLDAAIGAFRKAADLAPSSAVVFFRLGAAYMKKTDYSHAVPPLKRAAELNPDAPSIQELLGFALLGAGYASEAIPHFQKINEVGALGIAQLESGSPADAIANLQAALAKTPNDPDLLFYLSRAASQLASQSLDNLLASSPGSARAHQAKGLSYFQQKMYAEAEKEYQRALALRPDLPGLRLELGQIYEAQSDWPNAENEFRQEVKTQPGNAEAAYRFGDVLLQEGKLKAAAEELQRSNEIRPDMADTLYALGRATAASDPATAERAFSRVTELEKQTPLAAQAYLALAGVHRKLGKGEQASRDMQEYRHIQASIVATP